MISFQINIRNPFSNRFEIIKCLHGRTPIPNKFWEVQVNRTADIFNFDLRITAREDHAGYFLNLGLLGYDVIFNIYDNRHWDRQNNCWKRIDYDS